MAYFRLEFASEDAAMVDDPRSETVRILRSIIDKIESRETLVMYSSVVHDLNGRNIGIIDFDLSNENDTEGEGHE